MKILLIVKFVFRLARFEMVSQGKIKSCGNRCVDFIIVKNRIKKPTYEPVPELD